MHYTAFHWEFQCLSKYPFRGFKSVLKAGAGPGFLERGFICICERVRIGDFI